MATNTTYSFTVSGGTPSAVTAVGSSSALDGSYVITVTQDNTGVSLAVATPYGTTGQTGFTKGADIE